MLRLSPRRPAPMPVSSALAFLLGWSRICERDHACEFSIESGTATGVLPSGPMENARQTPSAFLSSILAEKSDAQIYSDIVRRRCPDNKRADDRRCPSGYHRGRRHVRSCHEQRTGETNLLPSRTRRRSACLSQGLLRWLRRLWLRRLL